MSDILCIIPARGGSKGLPRKNILSLCGKPLIQYTIDASLNSSYISRTIVDTDSEEIADIARSGGAEVPFLRPKRLAEDDVKTNDVILHALEWLNDNESYIPNIIVMLQPTSPLRTHVHVDAALELFGRSAARSVISVSECEHSIFWTNWIKNNRLEPVIRNDNEGAGRQKLLTAYRYNGAIYITKTRDFLAYKRFTGDVEPYIMNREESVDIDTEIDFLLVELIMSRIMSRKANNNGKVVSST